MGDASKQGQCQTQNRASENIKIILGHGWSASIHKGFVEMNFLATVLVMRPELSGFTKLILPLLMTSLPSMRAAFAYSATVTSSFAFSSKCSAHKVFIYFKTSTAKTIIWKMIIKYMCTFRNHIPRVHPSNDIYGSRCSGICCNVLQANFRNSVKFTSLEIMPVKLPRRMQVNKSYLHDANANEK